MRKLFLSVGILAMGYSYAQKVSWQKNVEYGTQDFLSGLAVTIDGQCLVYGSSIQKDQSPAGNNQNKGYDYHILKLDQQGQKVWEKYFSGNQHDYLSSTVSTREGGFYANPYDNNPGELLIIHQPISPSLEKFYQLFSKIGYMNDKMLRDNFEPEVLADLLKNNAFVGPPIDIDAALKKLKP